MKLGTSICNLYAANYWTEITGINIKMLVFSEFKRVYIHEVKN
jgi:hypothetical protein